MDVKAHRANRFLRRAFHQLSPLTSIRSLSVQMSSKKHSMIHHWHRQSILECLCLLKKTNNKFLNELNVAHRHGYDNNETAKFASTTAAEADEK
jgi:hypothetical protein